MDRQGCGSQSGVLQVNVIKAVGTLGLPEGHVPPATHWRRQSRLPTVSSESATTLGTRPPAHPARPPGTASSGSGPFLCLPRRGAAGDSEWETHGRLSPVHLSAPRPPPRPARAPARHVATFPRTKGRSAGQRGPRGRRRHLWSPLGAGTPLHRVGPTKTRLEPPLGAVSLVHCPCLALIRTTLD